MDNPRHALPLDGPTTASGGRLAVCRWLSGLAGIALVSAGFLIDAIAKANASPLLQAGLALAGCAFAVLGIASRRPQVVLCFGRFSLVLLALAFVLASAEVVFRIIGFDFRRLDHPGDDVPIYYRRATLPAGDGVFRRPGPATWRGRVLCSYMRMRGAPEGPYTNEQPVTAFYDASGFRNPSDLADWEVVVTGDSFVELGHLDYEDLFTTIAGKRLGLRIKNLGVSGTGPISQTFYVKKYGKSRSTKEAVLCFFEGNDLEDLNRELRNRELFRTVGRTWELPKQESLTRALYDRLRLRRRAAYPTVPQETVIPNAVLTNGTPEHPMTVYAPPPVWDHVSHTTRDNLVRALADWRDTVRTNGMRPWLMYIPDSLRVFHGLIRYTETNAQGAAWTAGDFSSHLGAACTNFGIGFINTLPALRREAEAGRIPYNLVGDTHFSRDGARIVADVLADRLKSAHTF